MAAERRQKLLTKEIEKRLPPLYSQQDVADPVVHAKFFTPWGNSTWYATEYDPEQRLFFGWIVVGPEQELGYFSLDELESVRGMGGLGVEREIYFTPQPLSLVKEQHARSSGAGEERRSGDPGSAGSDLPAPLWRGYLDAALWSSTAGSDDPRGLKDGDPLDKEYNPDDLDEESQQLLAVDVRSFLAAPGVPASMERAFVEHDQDAGQVGHDLWLTQNRYGVGFEDGYYGNPEDPSSPAAILTAAAHSLPERWLMTYLPDGADPEEARIQVS